MRWALVGAAGLLAYGAWRLTQDNPADGTDTAETIDSTIASIEDTIGMTTGIQFSGYSPAKVPEQYRSAIATAEASNGLPSGLLARLLWQESRYRESVITGRVTSPVGALGIAQFMPSTAKDMGIDPLDPYQAISAAAKYLAQLYRATGDWSKALAAYNWGIGNVLRKGMDKAPKETRNYFTQILADLGMGSSYA